MREFLSKIEKYNKGNIFITGGVNTGKTSILLHFIESSLSRGEQIFLIDGEDELNKIYKNKKNIAIKSIFISANLKKLKKFMSDIEEGDTIFVDGYQLLNREIVKYIKDLANSKKYRIVIVCDHPVKINLALFDYVLALRTMNSYSRHLGYDTTNLQIGDCLVNEKVKIRFPYEELIKYKKNLVINSLKEEKK